jgi:DNA polymerase-3 subunit delta
MKTITYSQFVKQLSTKNISPVYFFAGEETFLLDECLKRTVQKINTDTLNKEVFQAPDLDAKAVLTAAQTLPFLGDKRVVILKMANKLKNDDFKLISTLIEKPVETSCLIILFNDKIKDLKAKRKDLINLCLDSKKTVCVDCKKIYENEAINFVKEEFLSRKKQISFDLCRQIVQDTGTDLLSLSNEIDKICIYLGEKNKTVTEEDFIKISGFTKEINIYMFTAEIENKNLKKALFILNKMLQTGEKAVPILSAISTTVRRLLTAKSLLEEKHYSQTEVMDYIRIPAFFDFRKKYLAGLAKYKLLHLKQCLENILKTDIAIKTQGQVDEAFVLQKLVMFICK